MYPPGIGNDCLVVGNIYIISIYGTGNVFAANGNNLRVRTYTGNDHQLWKCVKDDHNRFSFINVATGKYLGRGGHPAYTLTCFAASQNTWKCLTLRALPEGGYRLSVDIDSRIRPALLSSNSGDHYMRAVDDSNTIVGLHQYNAPPPLRRFNWVITETGWLARSSAPNYHDTVAADNPDNTQNMDDTAVQFLVDNSITNVISMNAYELSDIERRRFSENNISYTHLPVVDFAAPTFAQLVRARQAYYSHISGRTLVYCGYGHGRTGTVITALKLYMGVEQMHDDYRANHVEDQSQFAVLDQLRTKLEFHN